MIYEVLKMFLPELLCSVTKVTNMWISITDITCDFIIIIIFLLAGMEKLQALYSLEPRV